MNKRFGLKFIFTTVFLIFGYSQVQAQTVDQLTVNCPSIYEILAPNDYEYFQKSRDALKTRMEFQAVLAGIPPNAFWGQLSNEYSGTSVNNVDDFIKVLTAKMKDALAQGAITKDKMYPVMRQCPIAWE